MSREHSGVFLGSLIWLWTKDGATDANQAIPPSNLSLPVVRPEAASADRESPGGAGAAGGNAHLVVGGTVLRWLRTRVFRLVLGRGIDVSGCC